VRRLTWVEPAAADALARAGLRTYDDFVRDLALEPAARTSTSRTYRIDIPCTPAPDFIRTPAAFYLKQFQFTGEQWRHRFRPSKAAVEAANYRRLRRAGVPVPDVIAYGSRRAGWRLLGGFILTRAIEADPLDRWWISQRAVGGPTDALRRNLAAALLDLLARMHGAGLYHVDLQWRNLLARSSGEQIELFVIDSSRGGRRWSPWMKRHGRLRDLSSLEKSARQFLSLRERLRFLRQYVAATNCREAHRDLARRIAQDRARKDA